MAMPVTGEIHSDWGSWLPEAVGDATPDTIAIWYLGCNGFILKASDGTTLFIDPYFGLGKPPRTVRMVPVPMDPRDVQRADGVLITHEHSDHVHGPSQAPIVADTDAPYLAPDASLETVWEEGWTAKWSVRDEDFQEVAAGDRIEIGGVTIHVGQAHDPSADHPVSYVIQHEGHTFFHGGDTRHDPDVLAPIGERFDIDLGVLAFGSVGMIHDKQTWEITRTHWYCDETEVVDAANALQIDRLLPSHWDMWKGLTADPTALHPHVRSFPYPERLDIVEVGDRVDL